ncbi:MAG: hypothetical protein GYA55_00885 [SAR324 cluster bacterium]|uniref:Uncharacterized protein n=1 Tax=SAR324 cluster bacterium TaxID=2024889 RepID=A0A7X9FP33_9DELT|nr:hypothetical protein [SAR324 cluster bacterium]
MFEALLSSTCRDRCACANPIELLNSILSQSVRRELLNGEILNGLDNLENVSTDCKSLDEWSYRQRLLGANEKIRMLSSVSLFASSLLKGQRISEYHSNSFKELVLWSLCNNDSDTQLCEEGQTYLESVGFDKAAIGLSVALANKAKDKRKLCETALINMDCYEKIKKGSNNSENLFELLQEYRCVDEPLSLNRLASYDVLPVFLKSGLKLEAVLGDWAAKRFPSNFGEKRFSIFLEAPCGFLLLYKQEPQAVIGFYASSPTELFIPQIQGIRGWIYPKDSPDKLSGIEPIGRSHARGLATVKGKELLIKMLEQQARAWGFKRVVIQRGRDNMWTRENEFASFPHLTIEEAESLYDHLALGLGYKRTSDHNLAKDLSIGYGNPDRS